MLVTVTIPTLDECKALRWEPETILVTLLYYGHQIIRSYVPGGYEPSFALSSKAEEARVMGIVRQQIDTMPPYGT